MRINIYFALLVVVVTMKSCAIYSPQSVDIPLIHKKKDFRFDGGISLLHPALNTTLSYGVTNKLAAQVYGNLGSDENEHYYHGAFGYYKNLVNNALIEVYGGAAFGKATHFYHSSGERLKGSYTLPFIQVNLGKLSTESSKLEYGGGFKTGFLNTDLTQNTFDNGYLIYDYNGLLLEPTVFLRPGRKSARINFKLSGCWIGELTNTGKILPYSRFNFGISLNVR